jgi:hypothetical protein
MAIAKAVLPVHEQGATCNDNLCLSCQSLFKQPIQFTYPMLLLQKNGTLVQPPEWRKETPSKFVLHCRFCDFKRAAEDGCHLCLMFLGQISHLEQKLLLELEDENENSTVLIAAGIHGREYVAKYRLCLWIKMMDKVRAKGRVTLSYLHLSPNQGARSHITMVNTADLYSGCL